MYATLAQIKAQLNIALAEVSADALLTELEASARKAIDAFCGRTFESAAAANRYFDPAAVDDRTLRLDRELAHLVSVTNGNGESVALGSIKTKPRNDGPFYALTIASTLLWQFTDGDSEITVNGHWAYSLTAPEAVRQATIKLVSAWYRSKDSAVTEASAMDGYGPMFTQKGMPADVKALLYPWRRISVGA